MQNQTIQYPRPLEWNVPSLLASLHVEFSVPHPAESCSLFLREDDAHYFDLSMWQRDIVVRPSAGNQGYTFNIIDYNRLLPSIEATGQLIPYYHNSTQVLSDVRVHYAGHMLVWGLMIFATLLFAVTGLIYGSYTGLIVMLIANLMIAYAFTCTIKRRQQLTKYIEQSLTA